ncbi:hypothetical protein SATMO3_29190 [Sporomusa aerivorans]
MITVCLNMNAGHAIEGVSEPFLDTFEYMKPVAAIFAKSVLAVDTNSIQPSIVDVLCVEHRSMIRPVILKEDSVEGADAGSIVLDSFVSFIKFAVIERSYFISPEWAYFFVRCSLKPLSPVADIYKLINTSITFHIIYSRQIYPSFISYKERNDHPLFIFLLNCPHPLQLLVLA